MIIHKYADPNSQRELGRLQVGASLVARRHSDDMFNKAIGYGWGRMDAGTPMVHADALDFGITYAVHVLSPGATHALREAFDIWHAATHPKEV